MQRWGKLLRLRPVDVVLLPGILVLVVLTRLALSFLPFPLLRKALDRLKALRLRWLARLSRERVTWMVKTAARFVPGASCLTQAIATELLCGFCGEAAETCFGVSRQDGRLEAHAWVESGGKVILGAPEAGKFTPLVRYR
jgi:Transglutaminase-like superfamily